MWVNYNIPDVKHKNIIGSRGFPFSPPVLSFYFNANPVVELPKLPGGSFWPFAGYFHHLTLTNKLPHTISRSVLWRQHPSKMDGKLLRLRPMLVQGAPLRCTSTGDHIAQLAQGSTCTSLRQKVMWIYLPSFPQPR